MTLRFGTDGVRGVANLDLTPELVTAFGRAAARVLAGDEFVIGRDTRVSGPLLEHALAAGLASEGITVSTLGVVPTPAVAWTAAHHGVAGAMISASHNKYPDNGVKLFAPGGRKLRDDVEETLEAELDRLVHRANDASAAPTGDAVGTITAAPEHLLDYADSVVDSVEGRSLDGLRIVIDCANGSATTIAPHVLRRLGADVIVIHADPNGTNINESCGSTHPDDLQKAVVEHHADAGLAFDGDADRVLAVDAKGDLVDGDQIIAACALDLRERGRLKHDTVVVTVMTNLGFRRAMADHGINVEETAVGDRFVLDALDGGGHSLGGEQSGHVIFADLATTGDGLLTGVQLLDIMRRTDRPLRKLAGVMSRYPQVLRNVRIAVEVHDLDERLAGDVRAAAGRLGDDGRVLIRRSGTEPLVRVMVEAKTTEQAEAVADQLADAVAIAAS
ncbi:MAG TPA: phosphoglucosamine mutase [Acidimicrobiales bacterium]|nr:phosphoglucosamine mutase [Acidimicrobiales bacterium]